MLQNGVSHRCACVKLSIKGGLAPSLGSASRPDKPSRDMGYVAAIASQCRAMSDGLRFP